MRDLQIDIYRMKVALSDDTGLISSFRGGSGGNFLFFLQVSGPLHAEHRPFGYGPNTNKIECPCLSFMGNKRLQLLTVLNRMTQLHSRMAYIGSGSEKGGQTLLSAYFFWSRDKQTFSL